MSLLSSLVLALGAAAPNGPAPLEKVDHSAFDAILKQSVRDQRVDYLSIRRSHHEALSDYLDMLAALDPEKLSKMELLAAQINLYNATMIQAVIQRFHADWTPAADDYAVFSDPLVRFGGETFSLNALENEKIRPTFQEPRIHVALVCGAVSCPPLLAKAYVSEGLRDVLEDNMYRFVRDRQRNPIELEDEKLVLSKIFEWYADDFGGPEGVPDYVGRYLKKDVSDFDLTHREYDWSLNLAPPRQGKWIVQTAPAALTGSPVGTPLGQIKKGEVSEVLAEESGWYEIDRGLGEIKVWVKATTTAEWKPKTR